MHSLLRHLHGNDDHVHADTAPQTTGTLIHWAKRYDFIVQFMAFGKRAACGARASTPHRSSRASAFWT